MARASAAHECFARATIHSLTFNVFKISRNPRLLKICLSISSYTFIQRDYLLPSTEFLLCYTALGFGYTNLNTTAHSYLFLLYDAYCSNRKPEEGVPR